MSKRACLTLSTPRSQSAFFASQRTMPASFSYNVESASLVHSPWLLAPMECVLYNMELSVDYPAPIVDLKHSYGQAQELLWRWRELKLNVSMTYDSNVMCVSLQRVRLKLHSRLGCACCETTNYRRLARLAGGNRGSAVWGNSFP